MILVTGGAGFIGINFVHEYLRRFNEQVVVLDSLTYASSLPGLLSKYRDKIIISTFDICDAKHVPELLEKYKPQTIVHFAAESHVDRSIDDSTPFIRTNVQGTENLLRASTDYYQRLLATHTRDSGNPHPKFKFVHISTDEVYGSLGPNDPRSIETSPYLPRSPYAASKAAADHLVMAYHHTHNLPVIITNCSNNYGPFQNVEKFIPTIITRALNDAKVPVYGTGDNIRDWIHVSDHVNALIHIVRKGYSGKFNIGGDCQITNLELTKKILKMMNKPESLIEFVEDRKGHDYRYDLNCVKTKMCFDWSPKYKLDKGLQETIYWYMNEAVKYHGENIRNHISSGSLDSTLPGYVSHNKTITSDLRQTVSLLPSDHIDAGGDQRHFGDHECMGKVDL